MAEELMSFIYVATEEQLKALQIKANVLKGETHYA